MRVLPERELTEEELEAAREVGNMVQKLGTAALALVVSLLVSTGLGAEAVDSIEVSVLNAGLAYYSHDASARIVRALVVLARAQRRVNDKDKGGGE